MGKRELEKGIKEFKQGAGLVLKIIEDLSKDYEDEIPVTLVIDKCKGAGVDEPGKILRKMAEHLAIVYTSPTTIAKTWPSGII